MKNSIKILVGIIIIIIINASLVYFGLTGKSIQDSSNEIKIGVILPLTGDLASIGESAKNAAKLSYNDLSFSQKEKMKIIFEDDQFNPQNTVSAFNKLVSVNKADVIVCFASNTCNAVAPLAESNKIPLIAIASDQKIQKGKKFVVRLEIAPSEEAKVLSDYIKKNNYRKIASVVAIQDGVKAGYSELKKDSYFKDAEIYSEYVNPNEKDFRTVITKIIERNPDVIFVGLLPGQAGDFGKQAKELGYEEDLIGFNFLEGEETLTAAKGSLNGLVYTNVKEYQSWFNEDYKNQYGNYPTIGSAHSYDAIKLISNSIENDKVSNIEIADCLSSIENYNGALGSFSSTDSHEFTVPVGLKTIRNNKFIFLK